MVEGLRRPRVADVVLAALMAVMTALYVLLAVDSTRLAAWGEVGLSLGITGCALWWRAYVRTVGVCTGLLLLGWAALFWLALPANLGVPPALVMAPLVVYAWTRYLPGHRTGVVALVVAGAGSWVSPAMWTLDADAALTYTPSRVVAHWALLACAYLLAARRRGVAEAHARELRAVEVSHELQLTDRRRQDAVAVQRERALIAREIHDVLAHSLTLIQVQSTAGLVAGQQDPGAAVEALRTVRSVTAEALGQVRGIVAVLRSSEEDATRSPGGDLRDVPAELDRFRQAGLELRASVPTAAQLQEAQGRLPVEVRLGIWRILQESLTNVIRHAGARARVDVELALLPQEVRMVVSNPIDEGREGGVSGGGYGLRGLSERASALGGWCQAGQVAGQFRVVAQIPVRGDARGAQVLAGTGQG